jgi:hypothetical protein
MMVCGIHELCMNGAIVLGLEGAALAQRSVVLEECPLKGRIMHRQGGNHELQGHNNRDDLREGP